jgi:hypothetical protein
LSVFNDTITREAARGLALIDLRLICTEDEDLANPIEPSVIGGARSPTRLPPLPPITTSAKAAGRCSPPAPRPKPSRGGAILARASSMLSLRARNRRLAGEA